MKTHEVCESFRFYLLGRHVQYCQDCRWMKPCCTGDQLRRAYAEACDHSERAEDEAAERQERWS